MNRKIKFRAYDKVRKEYLSAGKIFLTINSGKNPADSVQYLDVLRGPNLYANRFVIEQFTGLLDRNGTEIYEGDIILCKEKYIYTVEWMSDGFNMRGKLYGGVTSLKSFLRIEKEVIGNIHDNPDLLNGK